MTAPIQWTRLVNGIQTIGKDIREGFVEITHHSLAVFGLALVLVCGTFWSRPQLQASASEMLLGWLEIRQLDSAASPSVDTDPATATNLAQLSAEQLAVTRWLSRKYRVAMQPLGFVVEQAWELGERSQLPPTLILAIMAVESRFNPFASATPGVVGLMQIEQQTHAETLGQFGGTLSAFDPLTNLRVGVRHLQGLIQQTATQEDALALYGVLTGQNNNNQYVERILNEQKLLDQVAEKSNTPVNAAKNQVTHL
jgi:soluble lytic murein transglycosylase-like protein